jgi:hypothetical protein
MHTISDDIHHTFVEEYITDLFQMREPKKFLSFLRDRVIPEIEMINDPEKQREVIRNLTSRLNARFKMDKEALDVLGAKFPQEKLTTQHE